MNVYQPDLGGIYEELKFVVIADTHIGDGNFQEKELVKFIRKQMDDPNTRFAINGDLVNNGLKSSVTDTYEEVIEPGTPQIRAAADIFSMMGDRLLGIVQGNHERRSLRDSNISPAECIADKLHVPYFGNEVLFKFQFGKNRAEGCPMVYTAYLTHGAGGGRTKGAVANAMGRAGRTVVSDLSYRAHSHKILSYPDQIEIPVLQHNTVRDQKSWRISTGGWLTRGGYAVAGEFEPLVIGSPVVTLSGREREMTYSFTLH
jgi:hypothetical protein